MMQELQDFSNFDCKTGVELKDDDVQTMENFDARRLLGGTTPSYMDN